MTRPQQRIAWTLAVGLGLVMAAPAAADHCGADATITPSAGPEGTTFVFRTNLGAPSDLRLYRAGDVVSEVFLEGDGFVRHDIATGHGHAGQWLARAEVRGSPDCAAEATFTVLAAPDTATATIQAGSGDRALLALVAGLSALVVVFLGRHRSRSRSGT